jgi:riboflavin synthase alpha subunit
MFTGIVQGMAEVVAIEEKQDFRRHVVRLPQADRRHRAGRVHCAQRLLPDRDRGE